MILKERIHKDFIRAMKEKNTIMKAALSGLKAKIIEAEKANKNTELTDTEVLKVVNAAVKQRKQSFDAYQEAGRQELALDEYQEMVVLEQYLPSKLSIFEIEVLARNFIGKLTKSGVNLPQQAIIGKTMGMFNKEYPGQTNSKTLKGIIESVVK